MTIEHTPHGPFESLPCPTCGEPWRIGADPHQPGASRLLRALLGECADCRGMGDEPTVTVHLVDDVVDAPRNRAERRAAARRRPGPGL
jgi:hypothetical protein